MMKKVIKCILLILAVVIIAAGIFVAVKLSKDFPNENIYLGDDSNRAYTDEGMYFAKDLNTLYFFDNETGEETVVCNKANCQHNSDTCNAYFPGWINGIMCYGDKIYVTSSDLKAINDDATDIRSLTSMDKDGENRKTIYSSETGSVLSMLAIDDTLYFTSYVEIDNGMEKYDDNYTRDFNSYLYSYDLRWDRLKCLKTYEDNDEIENSGLYIINSQEKDTLYLTYSYQYNYEDALYTELVKYDIATGDTEEVRSFEDEDPRFFIADNKKYIIYSGYKYEGDEVVSDTLTIVECDDNFQDVKELISADNAHLQYYDGYIHIINTDYNKVLYDYEKNRFYVANTAFTQSGTYISDIFNVIKDKNLLYYDKTDYTGYMPGDLLPGDMTNNGVAEWDAFLSEYFIPYEDLSEEEKDELTWFTIY